MSIIIFLIILLVLVLVHEWGHFFSAKKFGIRVDEFGFGFPPKIASFKKGETEYSLNALPFGGFVKIYGENPDAENTTGPDASRSFVNKPKWQQAIVLFAGIFMNFILAWFLFSTTFLLGSPFAVDSIPQKAKEQMTNKMVVLEVLKESPAEKAGIATGDIILSVETKKEKLVSPTLEQFISFTNKPGESIHFSYLRNNIEMSADVIPEENVALSRAFVGITPNFLASGKFTFLESFKYGFQTTLLASRDTIISFKKLIFNAPESKELRDSIIGPVGLVKVTGFVSQIGFGFLISFAAAISVSLAVMNLIPFPALDGGRLLFVLIEKIKGSPIKPKVANITNIIGFSLLILLMLVVTYHDIVKLF
ncbi:MAG: site-2 protease family protein [Patescibacteria group bacterium]